MTEELKVFAGDMWKAGYGVMTAVIVAENAEEASQIWNVSNHPTSFPEDFFELKTDTKGLIYSDQYVEQEKKQ